MARESMNKRKESATKYEEYEDYENGKPRDKKQKKLNDFTRENI